MIVKPKTLCNEHIAGKANSLSLPHRNLVPSAKISNRKDHLVNGLEDDAIGRYHLTMGFVNIYMRLVIPLMFAFLPGLTQLPSLARSAVPTVAVPSSAQTTTTAILSPSSMDPDEILGRRRTMDAARLTLEDYSGKRRGKIPDSVKKQMDMQDRRLALCQEMSKDEWEWEQCFYYGTNNGGGGAMYFDGGTFAETESGSKTASNVGKQKIPTW